MATYTVIGMTCQGCASSVTNAITALSADAQVKVDLDAKAVSVEGFDDAAAIGEAVENAGFDFGGAV